MKLLKRALILCQLIPVLAFLANAQTGPDLTLDSNFYVIPEYVTGRPELFIPQYFFADVRNEGDAPAEQVSVSIQIVDLTENLEVFFAERNYGNLAPGDQIEREFINQDAFVFESLGPNYYDKVYRGRYLVTSLSEENNPLNDTLYFDVNMFTYAWNKENGRTGGVRLEGTENYVGTCYYIPEGETLKVSDVELMVDNADELVNGIGAVTSYLYQSTGDENNDGFIDSSEYNLIYFNAYEFDGTENQQLVRAYIDLEMESEWEFRELEGGYYYLMMLSYITDDEEDTMVISTSDDYNFTANTQMTENLSTPQYANATFFRNEYPSAIEPVFRLNGIAPPVQPIVRLVPFDPPIRVKNELPEDFQCELFPNPASAYATVALDFPQPVEALLTVMDQAGRLIVVIREGIVFQEQLLLDTRTWPSGVYTLTITTLEGQLSRRLVVQR